MHRRERTIVYLILAASVALALAAGCGKKAQTTAGSAKPGEGDQIKIGSYLSLTGDTAVFGISTKNGIDLAVDEINDAGGVLGKKIVVEYEDDASQTKQAATVVQKLISQEGVKAILGEVASSRSLAGAPICQRSRIPMLTPSSTNPEVTKKGDYIFRACYLDSFQGAALAYFAYNQLGARKAAILVDIKQDYSKGLASFFKAKFQELGGKIVQEASYQSKETDFRAQLTRIKAAKPDVVFVPGYYQEAAQIGKQAVEIDLGAPLLGGDGWEADALLEVAGTALDGCYYSNHYFLEDPSPTIQNFRAKYNERYKKGGKSLEPDAMAALGYDAARIMADAIERAGSTDPTAIRDALAQTKDFEGVTGKIAIDENRNASKPLVMLKIVGTNKEKVAEITPPQIGL
jgi:branched-chain amino acid transport system substrate-binding protein